MLFTSSGFTMNTLGAENQAASVVEGDLITPAPEEEELYVPAPSTEEEIDIPDATPLPEESELINPQPDPTTGQEELDLPADIPAPEAEPEESPIPEETPLVEELPEENQQTIFGTTDFQPMAEETSLFIVDADGKLQYDTGKSADQITNNAVIRIPKEAKSIPANLFKNTNNKRYSIVFEAGSLLEEIEDGAFQAAGVTSIEFPDNDLALKDNTFKFCTELGTITFGGVTSIGKECFLECTALTSLILGNDTKTVDENAFSGCTKIQSVTLNKVETIGARAFRNCSALTGIVWSSKITGISDYAFQDCTKLTTIGDMTVLNEPSLTLGRGIFSGCTSLSNSVNKLPNQMSVVPQDMFKDCTKLTGITLPESVTGIEAGAFSGCSGLTNISIPKNVMYIRSGAYALCNGLTGITIEQIDNAENQSTLMIAKDAFPIKSNITMSGYDGTVEEYAEMRGYTFVTMFGTYGITNKESFSNGTIKVSEYEYIKKGKNVKIYVTPNTGYRIKVGTVMGTQSGKPNANIDFIGMEGTTAIFSMNMPAYNVILSATFESIASVNYGKLSYTFGNVAQYIPTIENEKVVFDQTGQSTRLEIASDQTEVGSWEFTYSSSNTKVAVISNTGIVTARGEGSCTIKAVLTGKPSMAINIPVVVKSETEIDSIGLSYSKLDRAKQKDDSELAMTVIQLNKEFLRTGNRTFEVQLAALDKNEKSYMVPSKWEVVDTGIATVEKATTYDNQNTITVKKEAVGETTVTVTLLDKEGKKTDLSKTFIIRSVDATPRLIESKLTVNALSTVGTAFNLVAAYEYKIDGTKQLKVYEKKTINGITRYDESSLFEIADSNIRIISGKESEMKSATATYTNLVIGGDFTDGYGDFYVPIPTVTLTKKALAPTVKLTGSINMFYAKDALEQGTVQLTQSIKDVKVASYKLISDKVKDPTEIFAKNFEITSDGVITRSTAQLGQINGKDVVSGYVEITYEGYSDKITKAIKVPTVNKAPDYVLSITKATANSYAQEQEYKVQLISKKNKAVLDILVEDEIFIDNSDNGTTAGLFQSITTDDFNDEISIKVNGTPSKGKAVFSIQQSTWAKPLKYTFTLSTTTNLPKVKMGSSKISLNPLLKGQIESTPVTLDQVNDVASLTIDTFQYKGRAATEADKIDISYEQGGISANIKGGQTVAPGTYSFEFTPEVTFIGSEQDVAIAKSKINVVVLANPQPEVKLKTKTFSLNNHFANKEEINIAYDLKNLPTSGTYQVDNAGTLEANNNTSKKADIKSKISFEVNEGTITAKLTEQVIPAGTYSYKVEGMKINIDGISTTVTVKPFVVDFKVYNGNKAGVTLSAKGGINPIDSTSAITYTAKVSNLVSELDRVEVWEFDCTDGKNNYYGDNTQPTSVHFDVSPVDGKTVKVSAKDGILFDSKQKYKIRLVYYFEADPNTGVESKEINITPKQTLPAIKTDGTKPILYAGDRSIKGEVIITKTSNKGAVIDGVEWADKTPEEWKKAFRLSYEDGQDTNTGKVIIELVNPAYIKLNKEMTFNLLIKCENQMENTTGTKISIKTTVKK